MPNTDLSHKPSRAGNSPLPPAWPYAVALAALLLDQFTKRWFAANFSLYESRVVIPGFFNFTLARNTGAAFSLFQDHTEVLLVFSVVVFGLMAAFRDHLFARTRLEQWAYGLITGGVLGNLIDRMKYGYVVDFIDWYIGDSHWPIFNLADSWICIGVGLYLLSQSRAARKIPPTAVPELAES